MNTRPHEETVTCTIEPIRDGRKQLPRNDIVAVEAPLEIRFDGSPGTILMRTPGHDDELVRVVGESGYELAVTIDAGLVTAGSDPLRLPRYEIGDCPVDEFAALIDRAFGGEAANAPRG